MWVCGGGEQRGGLDKQCVWVWWCVYGGGGVQWSVSWRRSTGGAGEGEGGGDGLVVVCSARRGDVCVPCCGCVLHVRISVD